MTFIEKYQKESTWSGKVIIMGLFHNAMSARDRTWTITKTAESFGCSIGLVSENIRLAHLIDKNSNLIKCPTRQDALRRLNG